MQVEPQTPLPVVYQITDHTDPDRDSYYVRAVVRDSQTGATLKALNLTSNSNGRYSGSFNAPVDGTGLGRQIDVTTAVYTDSNYTSKHASYAEVLERWYVKAAPVGFGGGSSGDEIDYKKVRQIFAEEMAKCMADMEKPEKVDLSKIVSMLGEIQADIEGIEIPEPTEVPETDLSGVHTAIADMGSSLHAKIDAIEIPETDLYPVLEGLQNLADGIGRVHDLTSGQKAEITAAIEATVRDLYASHSARNDKVKEAIKALIETDAPSPTPAQPSKFAHLFKPGPSNP